MKQNISEILQRQLLLMGYRLDSTLSENIKNLPIIKEQTAPGTKLDTSYGLSPEEEEKRKNNHSPIIHSLDLNLKIILNF